MIGSPPEDDEQSSNAPSWGAEGGKEGNEEGDEEGGEEGDEEGGEEGGEESDAEAARVSRDPVVRDRSNLGDNGPMVDYDGIKFIKAGNENLRVRIANAKAKGKIELAKDLEAELSTSERMLWSSRNSTGKGRSMGSHAERARKATLKAIKKAIADIEQQHPALGQYLRTTIETGNKCSYRPGLAE